MNRSAVKVGFDVPSSGFAHDRTESENEKQQSTCRCCALRTVCPRRCGGSAEGQYFSGTLTPQSDSVNGDEELRSANLVFIFRDEANQLAVDGISLFPPAGLTIAVGAETMRPVIGGSGNYAGATGEAISTNLGEDGWSHLFHIRLG